MSTRCVALPIVALSLLLLPSCAVKIGGSSRPAPPPPPPVIDEELPLGQGTLTVLSLEQVEEQHARFDWVYTNDTDVEITQTLRWLCRGYDDQDFIIGTENVVIMPSGYGNLEPGVKLRGRRLMHAGVEGVIVRVECIPVEY